MSFFAGNGKVHITSNERSIAELNSNTIYPDTVFHSNMQSICSLGEYQSQASPVTFQVNGQTEYAFEASIPNEVRSHLLDNKVVLVQMGNISEKEAPITFPINIKVGTGGGTISDDKSYSVVTSPQVTTGGLLDVSFSVNQLANKNIVVHGYDEDGFTGLGPATSKINGWSTDPDYSVGGKVTNLLRPNSNFVQYHARGLRWRLSNYTTQEGTFSVPDSPYLTNLDGIQAPIFTFIVLNIRFVNQTYQFINPIPIATSNDILLQGNNLTINGTKFNTVKIIQSANSEAIGTFTLGKYLNRLLPAMSYTNVGIDTPQTRQYKRWSMVNFMQGAKHNNGMLAFMKNPGTYERVDCWYPNLNVVDVLDDVPYKAHICDYGLAYDGQYDSLGYPMPGYASQYWTTYRRKCSQTLLTTDSVTTGSYGYRVVKSPFALLDTSKFTSMYITKDGISGTYNDNGTIRTLPIWNTASPPTHMITGTTNISIPGRTAGVSLTTSTSVVSDDPIYMALDKEEESLLIGVGISNFVGSNLSRPSTNHQGGDDYNMMTWDDKMLSNMYTHDGKIHGLVKLKDGEELVIAQMYLQGGNKLLEVSPDTPGGNPGGGGGEPIHHKAVQILSIGLFVMYSIKREGNSLRRYTRVKVDYDDYINRLNDGSLPLAEWGLSYVNVPEVNAYVVRIQ